jgi:uncharacterized protein (TIGR02231 family)
VIFFSTSSAEPIESKVEKVTVFQRMAEVSRIATFSYKSGNQVIVLNKLSSFVDPNSIKVVGKGDFMILNVSFRQNYLEGTDLSNELKQLKTQIEQLEDEIRGLEINEEVLKQEQDLLDQNKSFKGNQGLSVQELNAMSTFFKERYTAILNGLHRLGHEKKQLTDSLEVLQKQFNDRTENFRKTSGEVTIEIAGLKDGTGQIKMNYLVGQVRWGVEYDIRSDGFEKDFKLFTKAQVIQNTGENWRDVELILSTGNPGISVSKPELYKWHLDLKNPGMYRKSQGVTADFEVAVMSEEASTLEEVVTTTAKTLNLEYQLDVPYSLVSGSKPLILTLREDSFEANYAYYTVPKLSEKVYLMGIIKTPDQLKLPGQANVFFEGGLVGKTYLNPETVKEEMKISLGISQDLQVDRERITDYTSKKVLGGRVTEEYAFRTTLYNKTNRKVSVVIEDQLPISRNKEIDVTPVSLSNAKVDPLTQKLEWTIDLDAGMSREVDFRFDVSYPKDQVVSGL